MSGNHSLQQCQLEQVAQNHVQIAPEHPQGQITQLLWVTCATLFNCPHSKIPFPDLSRQLPVVQLVPLVSCPATENH